MTESVKTGMMLFRRFRVTIVKGCSVVDGEIHEQTFVKGFNRHQRDCYGGTHQNVGVDKSNLHANNQR